MNRALWFACILLSGCASQHVGSNESAAAPSESTTEEPQVASTLVPIIDMQSLDDEDKQRCRLEKPTGSRIAVRRCDTLTPEQEELQGVLARREVEDMRQRQMYYEQARRTIEAAQRQRALGQ